MANTGGFQFGSKSKNTELASKFLADEPTALLTVPKLKKNTDDQLDSSKRMAQSVKSFYLVDNSGKQGIEYTDRSYSNMRFRMSMHQGRGSMQARISRKTGDTNKRPNTSVISMPKSITSDEPLNKS